MAVRDENTYDACVWAVLDQCLDPQGVVYLLRCRLAVYRGKTVEEKLVSRLTIDHKGMGWPLLPYSRVVNNLPVRVTLICAC